MNGFNFDILESIGTILIGISALFISILNLRLLRRMNIVDSMRRVNDKYTELNILELENESLIRLNHNFIQGSETSIEDEIERYKRNNMIYNHINVLESIYTEMKYKTMKKEHALKLLNWFAPQIVNNPQGNFLIRNSGYDDEFVNFCLKFELESKS